MRTDDEIRAFFNDTIERLGWTIDMNTIERFIEWMHKEPANVLLDGEPELDEDGTYEHKCPHCGNNTFRNLSECEYNRRLRCFEQVETCIECGGRWVTRWKLSEVKALVEK